MIFASDVRKAQIFMDNEYIGETPFAKKVKFGSYKIKMKNPDYEISEKFAYNKLTNSNSVIFKSLKPVLFNIDVYPSQADIYLDDRYLGKGSIFNEKIKAGEHLLYIQNTGYETKKIDTYINANDSQQYNIKLTPKSLYKALIYSMVVPGLGQVYSERSYKNLLYSVIEVGGLIGVYSLNNKMHKLNDQYNNLIKDYRNAMTNEEFELYHRQIEKKYDDIGETKKLRNTIYYAVAAVVAVNLLDTYIWWPFDDNDPGYNISMKHDRDIKNSQITISIPLN